MTSNDDLFSRIWVMQPPGAGWFVLCEGSPLKFSVLAQGSKATLALNPKYHLTTIAATVIPMLQQPE